MRTTDAMREVLARPIAKVPALRGRQRDDPVLRGLDADARVASRSRPRTSRPTSSTSPPRRSSVSKGESLVDTVRTVEALGAQHAGDAPPRRRARRTSPPRSSAGPCSTAATAGTPTRPRRCSTCTRSGRGCPAASLAGPQGRDPGRRPPLAGGPLEHLDADRGRRRPVAVRAGDAPARVRGVGAARRGGRAAVPRDDVGRRGAARRRRRSWRCGSSASGWRGPAAVAARVRGALRADPRAAARSRRPRRWSCTRADERGRRDRRRTSRPGRSR